MYPSDKTRPSYRFAAFTLSPGRRVLLHEDREVPLIPRYFDLLLLLLERRHEAVERREILEAVWSDVVVSDGALSQAIRTLRRALHDDSRSPVFIRTVSRHGYQFVFPDVVEAPEGRPAAAPTGTTTPRPPAVPDELRHEPAPAAVEQAEDPFEPALERLLRPGGGDERREAAETLHVLGTVEALRRLGQRPGHERSRALLRDARWAVPGAGPVPLLGQPGALRSIGHLVALRLRHAARLVGARWWAASLGGAAAGALAGLAGGLALSMAPGSDASFRLAVVLAILGAAIGGLGAAGVGAGLAIAEALARSYRGVALVLCGAAGGGAIGALAHLLGSWTVEGVFGQDLSAAGGGFEGIVIGAAAGLGYALTTPRPGGGGMATPRGWERLLAAAVTGLCCAVAAVGLTWTGSRLGGVSLDLLARTFHGSHVGLAPIARLLGEEGVGPVTRTVLGAYEGFLFGLGLTFGLTRRPRG